MGPPTDEQQAGRGPCLAGLCYSWLRGAAGASSLSEKDDGQIHVADVLKRIKGISDADVLGRKYSMRICIDPDRLGDMKIAPREVIVAIQQENVQAAAGKIGGRPFSATGQGFRACRSPLLSSAGSVIPIYNVLGERFISISSDLAEEPDDSELPRHRSPDRW